MHVFITGASGYLGRRLGAALAARGHEVRGLVRPGRSDVLPPGVLPVIGDALDAATWRDALHPDDTLVHLVGTPHPGPGKSHLFECVDWVSIREAALAARAVGVAHVVYVSVAQPAPVMRDYIDVRVRGEAAVAATGLRHTILRPWYVLGPGHWWPVLLLPAYALASLVPAWRESARALGLVTIDQMTDALVAAVEQPPDEGARVVDVPGIRAAGDAPRG